MGRMSARQRAERLDRRDGHASVWTGVDDGTLVPQHRANRGMGSARSLDSIENWVWLEARFNQLIEDDPDWAAQAVERGIKVPRNGPSPLLVPVEYPDGCMYWLTADGRRVLQDEVEF